MKVAFIAVNYNNYLISLNNINNIMNLKGDIERDVIIVDNASISDDYRLLVEGKPELTNITIVRSEKNLGYFGGLKLGLESITPTEYDYVIIANNDLIYRYDFLQRLENAKYEDDCLVVAPELITLDGRYQNPQRVNKPSKMRRIGYALRFSNYYLSIIMEFIYGKLFRSRIKKSSRITTKQNIFQLTGACMILTPEYFCRCKSLDNSVFMWGEEMLLAHQVEVAKGITVYDPSLYVLHMESASVMKVPSKKSFKMKKESYKVYKDYYK